MNDATLRMAPVRADRWGTALWIVQRASAAVLALCVLAHLATILVAMRGGLTAPEILGRTRGSDALFAFYTLFALAACVHAPIGLRTVLREWVRLEGRHVDIALALVALGAFALSMRAIVGVTR